MIDVSRIIASQRAFFNRGETRPIAFRIEQLRKLKQAIVQNEQEIYSALRQDLGKSDFESYITEIGILLEEIKTVIRKLPQWAKAKKVPTPWVHFPASSRIIPEPLGVALIIGPWNYPFQLIMGPLIGAIAAGDCAVIKPSEFSAQTSRLVARIIAETFPEAYITVVEGESQISQALLKERFDLIFFTGSVNVGKIVMEAAAQHLTPVILELGGKSPAIVDRDTNIRLSARRIASGKFINAGQTCIAPDYLLVHHQIRDRMVQALQQQIELFFGKSPATSPDYPKIINTRHFDRLVELMESGRVIHGGKVDRDALFIEPTLIDAVSWDDAIMAEEIFGPVLPILTFETIEQVIPAINARPKPLALYLFSNNRKTQNRITSGISYGGGCINDTLIHLATPHLPFGGVGDSGMGNYHGKASFDGFSHHKSVLTKSFWFDNPFRYPPFKGKLKLVKKIMG